MKQTFKTAFNYYIEMIKDIYTIQYFKVFKSHYPKSYILHYPFFTGILVLMGLPIILFLAFLYNGIDNYLNQHID